MNCYLVLCTGKWAQQQKYEILLWAVGSDAVIYLFIIYFYFFFLRLWLPKFFGGCILYASVPYVPENMIIQKDMNLFSLCNFHKISRYITLFICTEHINLVFAVFCNFAVFL